MKYQDLLRDPRWQRKRLEIMNRDGWCCQSCGTAKTTLNVHHKRYINGRKPWEYSNELLVTVCEKCHVKIHDDADQKQRSAADRLESKDVTRQEWLEANAVAVMLCRRGSIHPDWQACWFTVTALRQMVVRLLNSSPLLGCDPETVARLTARAEGLSKWDNDVWLESEIWHLRVLRDIHDNARSPLSAYWPPGWMQLGANENAGAYVPGREGCTS